MDESRSEQRPDGDKQSARGSSVLVTACDQCYRCKVRCSGQRDACDRCLRNDNTCTYSLGRPLGKPPKKGRGRAPKNHSPRAKRLSRSNDTQASSSSRGKRRRLGGDSDVSKLNPLDAGTSGTSGRGESSDPIDPIAAEPSHPPSTLRDDAPRPEPVPGEMATATAAATAAADVALHGFDMDLEMPPLDMDMDMDLDLDIDPDLDGVGMSFDPSLFGYFMHSPRPDDPAFRGTPAPAPAPAPVTTTSATDANAALITPPISLSSGADGPPVPVPVPVPVPTRAQLPPTLVRLISDLYSAPHSTDQRFRFDRTLLLARQGLDVVISSLPGLATPRPPPTAALSSAYPNSPLLCVIIVQQVLANYKFLQSLIASRLLSLNLTSRNAGPTPVSLALPPVTTIEDIQESVCVGTFEVEGVESQCHVMNAIVNLEVVKLEKVLIQLTKQVEELSKDGNENGNLAHLILVALKARSSTGSS